MWKAVTWTVCVPKLTSPLVDAPLDEWRLKTAPSPRLFVNVGISTVASLAFAERTYQNL